MCFSTQSYSIATYTVPCHNCALGIFSWKASLGITSKPACYQIPSTLVPLPIPVFPVWPSRWLQVLAVDFRGEEPQSVYPLASTSHTQHFVHGIHLLCCGWQFDGRLNSTIYLATVLLDIVWGAFGPYLLCINKTFLCILLNIGIVTGGEMLSHRRYEFYLNRDCLTIFQTRPTHSTTLPPEAGGSVSQ